MTRALILAAGEGTRLRPLTNNKPKCLVPLQGKPLIERQIYTLRQSGIKDIHIVAGYRSEQLINGGLGCSISVNERYSETNMVATLFSAIDFIRQEGDLIIAYGDIVYQTENLALLLECGEEICLMIDQNWKALWSERMDSPLDDAETLIVNNEGYIIELGKKPESYENIQGQYTGLIKICSDRLEELEKFYMGLDRNAIYDEKNFENMYMTSFIQLLINSGWKAKAVMVNNGWLEVDSIEDLEKYEALAELGKLDQYYEVEC